MVNEPPRGFGKGDHAYRKYNGRNYLESPWYPERRNAIDVRAAELYEILDENTPRDRPLLNRDEATAD
jgi:hypothetical protein